MPSDVIQQAIELIHQKRKNDAQKLLEPILIADPHDLTAWLWYVETISSNRGRTEALELCLKHNPDNPQVEQLVHHFRSRDSDKRINPEILKQLLACLLLAVITCAIFYTFIFALLRSINCCSGSR